MKLKYMAVYHGPSYFSYDDEYVMGFTSLQQAKDAFLAFQSGGVSYKSMRQNEDGNYIEWEEYVHSLCPGTTEEDYMDVYHAQECSGGLRGTYDKSSDPYYRISLGPRKGAVVENF